MIMESKQGYYEKTEDLIRSPAEQLSITCHQKISSSFQYTRGGGPREEHKVYLSTREFPCAWWGSSRLPIGLFEGTVYSCFDTAK